MAPSIFLLCFYLMLWTASDCFIQSRSAAYFLVKIQFFPLRYSGYAAILYG